MRNTKSFFKGVFNTLSAVLLMAYGSDHYHSEYADNYHSHSEYADNYHSHNDNHKNQRCHYVAITNLPALIQNTKAQQCNYAKYCLIFMGFYTETRSFPLGFQYQWTTIIVSFD